jgi:hypothetical protein
VWEVEETILIQTPFTLVGPNRNYCHIHRNGDFGPSFRFGASSTLLDDIGLVGVWLIDENQSMTVANSPFHIDVDHAAKGLFDFRVSEGAGIIRLAGCYKTYLDFLAAFTTGSPTGRIGVLVEKSAQGGSDVLGGDIHFQRSDIEGSTSYASPRLECGYVFKAGDGIYIEAGCHVQHTSRANVLMQKNGTDQLSNIRIAEDVLLDICQGHGIEIDGSVGSGSIDQLTVKAEINCVSLGAASKHGVYIHSNAGLVNSRFDITANGWKGDGFRNESPYVQDLTLQIKSKACDEYAVYIYDGDRINVISPSIGATGSEDIGIRIGAAVTDLAIAGGNISECVIGIQIDAGADEIKITGVDLTDNATPLNDLSTSRKNIIRANPGAPDNLSWTVPAGATLLVEDTGRIFNNTGATARSDFILPAAAKGLRYGFMVMDTDGIRVTALLGHSIRVGASVSASGGRIDNAVIGSVIWLVGISTDQWVAESPVGTWTVT